MAHDLRTPLQAFQSELELLFDIAQKECGDVSQSMVKSIRQLQRIGNFMNMTINRCIDFTKVTSGIKLKPSIESISFPDTVNWAVGVMAKNCSTTVPIVLVPIPTNIHNQIFTDKLWLMENLLCLVSNAQKFTTEGEITVRCSLRSGMLTSIGRNLNLSSRGTDNLISDSDLRINATNDSAENECGTPMIRIAVEDTGIGIAKESRSRLFQPFMQVCSHDYSVLINHVTIHWIQRHSDELGVLDLAFIPLKSDWTLWVESAGSTRGRMVLVVCVSG